MTAIIGILASLMLPSYQQYLKKARFTEVVLATAAHKTAVETAIQTQLVTDLTQLKSGRFGIPKDMTKERGHLASLTVENGQIIAQGNEVVDSLTYVLSPAVDAEGQITYPLEWQISGSCVTEGLC